jgi:HK97 gp10 family phage protein
MANSFTADLRKFGEKVQRRARDVARQSIQDVVEDAQTPKAKGGRMPVDTGFLRNSLVSGIDRNYGPPSPESYVLAIAGLEIGDTVQFNWTAEYAIFQELGTSKMSGNHFVGVAAAKWPQFVKANAERVK